MDSSAPVITNFSIPEFGKVVIEVNDGKRYYADLRATFSGVYCFPRSEVDWKEVAIDSYGMGLIWTSRFEVHVDQIIGVADKSESIQRAS